jgi:acyl-CoA synthetase (NDP forming)
MLGARSVAIVGASARPDTFGARMVLEAQRSSARFHLVNPRYDRIGDMPCVPAIADIGEPVDLVLLGVPDAVLAPQLKAAAAAGARSAVLFGAALGARDEISDIAAEAGLAVCGAGCMGFVNNALGVRALGYLEPDPLPQGGISLITHSGSAFSTLLRSRRGFGFRLAVSSGQELVTDTADYVNYALDDGETRMVALLLETPRAAPRLAAALHRAAAQDVPVVILPVGASPRGSAMVAAHSGALAGGDAAWHAFCASTGAVRVHDLADLTDTLELFSNARRPGGRGRGIATVHDSGAERALAVDVAHDVGVPYAELRDTTIAALADVLDDGLSAANPLDVWGTGAETRTLFGTCLKIVSEDPDVAVTALAVDLVTEFDGDTSYPDAILDVAAGSDAALAVLASVPSAVDDDTAQMLRGNGIAVLEGMRSGLLAMGHLAAWPLPRDGVHSPSRPDRARRWRATFETGSWGPASHFELLADYGIPAVRSEPASSTDEAVAAARRVGYPVALKTVGVEHKSDVGGVVLDLADEAGLRVAYADMAARLGPDVSIDAMVSSGIEVSVGFVRDPAFGALLVVAAGGVLVELRDDRAVACPPVSRTGALRLLDGMRMRPMLDGWRAAPAVDLAALIEVIVGFSDLATELGDALDAVEANPVIVSADGAVAVDVLVVPRPETPEPQKIE